MYRTAGSRHNAAVSQWETRAAAHPMKEEWEACLNGKPLAGWTNQLPVYEPGTSVATRQASGDCLNALLPYVPALMAGGADLTGNTGTMVKGATKFSAASPEGRQIHFGVREHGMGAVMNGLAAHGGSLPVGGTFFVFSDYMRGAVRVAAIQSSRVVYSWTHDSIGVGEDGPTHQPVEHLASLRAMPNLRIMRPGDANEVAAAWRVAIWADSGPTALILSRQKIPVLVGTKERANSGVERGAYILVDPQSDNPDVVLVGTGSEVQHCVEAAKKLREEGYDSMVVSMPSWDLFDDQDEDYQEQVFPSGVPVVACEAGASMGWERFADISVTMDTWGSSAPTDRLMEEYGFDADAVVEAALLLLEDDEL
jgi:transketolase